MSKPSWLSYINFAILIFMFCSYFGIINLKSWFDDIHNKSGIKVTTPIQELDTKVKELEKSVKDSNLFWGTEYHNFLTKSEFNQYQHLSKDEVTWVINSIKDLQGNTTLSRQINYWKTKYGSNKCADSSHSNADVCKSIDLHLLNLEQKLSK